MGGAGEGSTWPNAQASKHVPIWTPPSLPSSPAAQTSAGQDNRESMCSDNSSVLLQLLGLFIKGYVQVKFKKDLALLFIHRCIQEHLELLQAFSSH